MDDPLYVEEEEDDYWYRGYNMRTGERGIFPAFYAHEVIGQSKELMGELSGIVYDIFSHHECQSSHTFHTCVSTFSPCRHEKKPSVDRDFQRPVSGVC